MPAGEGCGAAGAEQPVAFWSGCTNRACSTLGSTSSSPSAAAAAGADPETLPAPAARIAGVTVSVDRTDNALGLAGAAGGPGDPYARGVQGASNKINDETHIHCWLARKKLKERGQLSLCRTLRWKGGLHTPASRYAPPKVCGGIR